MKCILKIARSAKNNKVYAAFVLSYCNVFLNIDDAVKLTGISYSDLNLVTVDGPMLYTVELTERVD